MHDRPTEGRLSTTRIRAAARALLERGGPRLKDARYFLDVHAREARARLPAAGIRRRHADGLQSLASRAVASRGVVVYLPTIPWGSMRQRPQQLMRELGRRGYVCVFCSPRPRRDGVSGLSEVATNVFVCSDVRLAMGFERPILWVNWPANAAFLPFFPDATVVYDFIDDLEVFHTYGPAMERDHARLVRDSGVVVATADHLLERVRPMRPDTVLAPNAVCPEDFAHAARAPADLERVLAAGRPVVGYYGALAQWFDYHLFNQVAASAPDLSFVLLGPDHDGSARLVRRRANVHLLGEKRYEELAAYARRFDVAVIPFRKSEIARATSPVKLFEYMAAGAPIVTTPMHECVKYRSVQVAETAEDFVERIRAALGRRHDPAHQALLAADVAQNTWAERVDRVLARLDAVGQAKGGSEHAAIARRVRGGT